MIKVAPHRYTDNQQRRYAPIRGRFNPGLPGRLIPESVADSTGIRNCTFVSNTASCYGGAVIESTLYGSTLECNSAEFYGGGAYLSTLFNCTIIGNSANINGGGVSGSVLYNCVLTGNSANNYGGGADSGTLHDSTLTGNTAYGGGGVYNSTIHGCSLIGNSSDIVGGGAFLGNVNNSSFIGNSSGANGGGVCGGTVRNSIFKDNVASKGGGAYQGTIYNCTLTGNSATSSGGGAYQGTLVNSIVYYNTAPSGPNWYGSTIAYSCTKPLPGGTGNTTNEPCFASEFHLATNSPCIGVGSGIYASGTDVDGETWQNPPSMGCDEVMVGAITGDLSISVSAFPTNPAVTYVVDFRANITGLVTRSVWDFGDGTVISNWPCIQHAYASPGLYNVQLTAYNETYPAGISATIWVTVSHLVIYVRADSVTPVVPYATWATAANNIQAAVNVAYPGDLVLVTNGVYATGGKVIHGDLINRVAIDKPITVRSINGPEKTLIVGNGPNGVTAIRCAYVGANASLIGFTLTNGHTRTSEPSQVMEGGGAWCASSGVISNCILVCNSACIGGGARGATLYNCELRDNSASGGGGAVAWCTLWNCMLSSNSAAGGGGSLWSVIRNCTLIGNSANTEGGGSYFDTLYNCTLIGNSANNKGGGAYNSTLYNSIVYYNTAPSGPNWYGSTLAYSCTKPLPGGTGNITNEPCFVNEFHLATNSPCIGVGSGIYASGTDVDGETWRNPPSMGCDEVMVGAITGDLSVSVSAFPTNPAVTCVVDFRANITGLVTRSVWDFGDGTVISNWPCIQHAYALPGLYNVQLTAYNETYPAGISATIWITVPQLVIYVRAGSATPVVPYATWATAANNIQAAVNVAYAGDLVLVTNGVYATGGKVIHGDLINRVAIDKPITVRSINGPEKTLIVGNGPNGVTAIRCAYVGANASLIGFTFGSAPLTGTLAMLVIPLT